MEKTTNIFCASEVQNLIKRLPTVILTDGISLFKTNMVIRGYQYPDCIGFCGGLTWIFWRSQITCL